MLSFKRRAVFYFISLCRWAAASTELSLNAMILPAALYYWQIPHFMALAYLCRSDYLAGG
jgi:heme o synthase